MAETYSYEALTPEEKEMIDAFVRKIDLGNSEQILHYGSIAQQKITTFSDQALAKVQTKDLGQIGDQLSGLVVQLKALDKPKTTRGLFGRVRSNLETMKAQYQSAEGNVNNIVGILQKHSQTLSADIVTYDAMYRHNLEYFRELGNYIIAGKRKIQEEREGKLAELYKKSQETQDPADAQLYNDYQKRVERFEKKVYDLELTRQICLQMGMQIRMSQDSDEVMVEKIATTVANTIPLWKSQMVLAFGLEHARQAAAAQKAVSDMTNDLLISNAELMKMGTIAVAKEAERGIVDIETLAKTNETLISTLDEVKAIHLDGRKKREAAEQELVRLEKELQHKLLENHDAE